MSCYTTEEERREVEKGERWESFVRTMPRLTIPEGFQIKVIPATGGAIVRFLIFKGERSVSVYFDAYSRLGYCPDREYWEAYPIDGDNRRYNPGDHEAMMADIVRELHKATP